MPRSTGLCNKFTNDDTRERTCLAAKRPACGSTGVVKGIGTWVFYSSRKLEEACQYRIAFRWLLEDHQKIPDHSTLARFRIGCCKEVVDDARNQGEWIERTLGENFPGQGITVDRYENGQELVESIQRGENYQILLLDIEVPQLNGVDTR